MSTPSSIPERPRESNRMAWVAALALAGLLMIGGVLYFGVWKSFPAPPASVETMTPAEQAYAAAKIQFADLRVSRAENFLHQEVTTVSGAAINTGDRTLDGLQITAEFQGMAHETLLRQNAALVTPRTPLGPGKAAGIDISLENVPPGWNQGPPRISVRSLRFAPAN
jgi:hypothetical protein